MSAGKISLFPKLEKLKAGLGAAGMTAIGLEAIGPRLLGGLFSGPLGNIIPIVGAVLGALIAAHFTQVSEKEAALESKAKKESVM
ncbi:hypothetical protein [Azospirillum thiophilum]|uniref:hypothetical protein n=1 Tax=Azospirillum thiophilum TaxID=528244 RepID=UPI0011874F8A|nr:hypothetical protein [Azospirillum thiophilum]